MAGFGTDVAGSWEELSAVDRAMARQMQRAAEIPLATLDVQVAVDAALGVVERLRPTHPELTFTAVLVAAVGRALRLHPKLASVVDLEARRRFIPAETGVGVAVHTDRGLVVPVVPGASVRPLGELAAALAEVISVVRSGRPDPAVFAGGHFTVTNIAAGGIDGGTPMVNPPQSAILGVGTARDIPVVRDGAVTVQRSCRLTLSLDHRALDGMTAAAFLTEVRAGLEGADPLLTEATT